jgi:predicted nucleic acid-binding protein
MLLIVDANVIISSLINKGETFKVFKYNDSMRRFTFIAPEFLLAEINIKRILRLSHLSRSDVEKTFSALVEQIEFIPFSKFSDTLPEAMKINLKDSPYLALALKYKCPIFSGDKGLKQQKKVTILSPREVLDIFEIK